MAEKLSGGGNNEWLQELTHDGNLPSEGDLNIQGCHRGHYTVLNIVNPQPGFEYQWPANNPRELMSARRRGWRQLQEDDPEMTGLRTAIMGDLEDSDMPTQLDTTDLFQDVIPMKTTSENLARLRQENEDKRKAMLRGGAEAFVRGSRSDEIMAGQGRPTRFADQRHSLEFDEDGRIVDQWTPQTQPKGIITKE